MNQMLKIGAIVAVASLCVEVYFELRESPRVSASQEAREKVVTSSVKSPTPIPQALPAKVETLSVAENISVKTVDPESSVGPSDYFEFAKSIVGRANAGDANAQFQLYAALAYCDETYRAFFHKPNGTTRTLDDALQHVSTRPGESVDFVRTAYTRCARINDSGKEEFGVASHWLKLATDQGLPLALATTAEKLITDELTSPERSDATMSSAIADAMSMFLEALKSKDPEVVWKIGHYQTLLDGTDEEKMLRQWSWWLAACQRGYDCENSRLIEYACRFDQLCAQDKNAIDYIRRNTDLDFPEIEARAKQINANIDSESWDALGLVPPQ